jgi:hypothetical protein
MSPRPASGPDAPDDQSDHDCDDQEDDGVSSPRPHLESIDRVFKKSIAENPVPKPDSHFAHTSFLHEKDAGR